MSAIRAPRLALGTVQLGLPYGITNRTGQPDLDSAAEIVAESWRNGVRYFDTAQRYGESERVLGECLRRAGITRRARVISKLDPKLAGDPRAIRESVLESCRRLGKRKLWALLLHTEDLLDEWNGPLGKTLRALRDEGRIGRLGVSIYTASRARQALESPDMTVLQIPANVFDRRMLRAGVLARARELGKSIFVRSVYLQGLLFLDPDSLPARAAFAEAALRAYRDFCAERGLDPRLFALAHARARAPRARLVIGAKTPAQALANAEHFRAARASTRDLADWDARWPEDVEPLVNPSLWPPA